MIRSFANNKYTSCPFEKCRYGFLAESTIRGERDHVKRYHQHTTETIGTMGAVFYFRRDPSRQNKYVCACGKDFPNRYSLRYHVYGRPSKSQDPCRKIRDEAIDIVENNIICDDDTKPIGYRPAGTLRIQKRPHSDIDVVSYGEDENTHPDLDVDPDENVASECDSHVNNHVNISDDVVNPDFRGILKHNDLILENAIKALQQTRADIQKLLQSHPK
ncbi:hypothetical protein BG005_001271 [Podila minutissima]|nr:hypothetical protein BG005_001271 [Podila minutissima]